MGNNLPAAGAVSRFVVVVVVVGYDYSSLHMFCVLNVDRSFLVVLLLILFYVTSHSSISNSPRKWTNITP
jgi:hypothetical protein